MEGISCFLQTDEEQVQAGDRIPVCLPREDDGGFMMERCPLGGQQRASPFCATWMSRKRTGREPLEGKSCHESGDRVRGEVVLSLCLVL